MANTYFQFKQFKIEQRRSPMKVCTDACVLGATASHDNPGRILDIGAGTGLLALMLAQRFDCLVHAVEFNKNACCDAELNFSQSPWSDRLTLFCQRFQDFTPPHKYDLIICNPPFFANHQKSVDADKNRATHADHLPLSDLVKGVLRLLSSSGFFYVLLPPDEWKSLDKMMKYAGFYRRSRLAIRNFPEKSVFRVVSSYAFHNVKQTDTGLIIKNNPSDYTSEFKDLLAPFYLAF